MMPGDHPSLHLPRLVASRFFPTASPGSADRPRIDPTNPTYAEGRTHPELPMDAGRCSDEIVIVLDGPIDRSRLVCPYRGLTRPLVRLGKGVEARRQVELTR